MGKPVRQISKSIVRRHLVSVDLAESEGPLKVGSVVACSVHCIGDLPQDNLVTYLNF